MNTTVKKAQQLDLFDLRPVPDQLKRPQGTEKLDRKFQSLRSRTFWSKSLDEQLDLFAKSS
jgi:hypothetical protein